MKLSVLMMTYNHDKFIAQALDSVLMQEVNFEYEIIIGEDCSQDNTREILLKYQNKYPDKIRLLLHEKNIGAAGNQIACMKACTGEYIAMLEGDDYWTDPHKLQKQVDFLESNHDYTLCFHSVSILNSDGCMIHQSRETYQNKDTFSFEDYINGFYNHTCSLLIRNDQLAFTPIYEGILPPRDNTIQLLSAEKGNAYYIDKVMSCYRIHVNGCWTTLSEVERLKEGMNYQIALLKHYASTKYKVLFINAFYKNTLYGLKRLMINKKYDLFLLYFFSLIFCTIKYRSFSILVKNIVVRAGRYLKLKPEKC
jgi:glycosyltransferase involved in cell wall biosynthesis